MHKGNYLWCIGQKKTIPFQIFILKLLFGTKYFMFIIRPNIIAIKLIIRHGYIMCNMQIGMFGAKDSQMSWASQLLMSPIYLNFM